jgi:hypothetical protein
VADPGPPRLVVKIGSAGDVHLDFKPANLELMQDAVGRLNAAGGIVVYYGESPYQPASEAALATFKQLVALKPRILVGTNAPSEWGRLDWVEIQRNPAVARIFFRRGEKFLLSPAAAPDQPKQRVLVGGPLSASSEDTFFKAMDLIVRAARVLESPQQAPELSMDEHAVARPSLHLRLSYATRRWASAFQTHEIPTHIASFERDLWWLASETFAHLSKSGRELSGQAALEFFDSPKQV